MHRRDLLKSLALAPFALASKKTRGGSEDASTAKSVAAPSPRAKNAATYPLRFTHSGVAAGECVEVVSMPALAFIGRELALSDTRFDVLNVFVGNNGQLRRGYPPMSEEQRRWLDSCLRTLQPIPPLVRQPHVLRFSRPLDVAVAGVYIRLVVRNTSDQAAPFTGVILGTTGD